MIPRPPVVAPRRATWTFSDGYVAHGRVWPGQNPVAVLYLHGIQSHGGWYEWSASLLAAAGLTVVMPDRRGSGLNPAQRGDVPDAQRWLDDLDELARWTTREFRPRRLALVGVSWGGKLAAAWASRAAPEATRTPGRPLTPAALLLVAPGVFPAVGLGFVDVLAIGAALLTSPTQPFALPFHDSALFTGNAAGRAFIDADPLKLTHASARFLYLSRRLDRDLARLGAGTLSAPTTLVLSGADRIIRNDATRRWAERVFVSPGVIELPDAPHTVEFEADPNRFHAVLADWAARVRRLADGP